MSEDLAIYGENTKIEKRPEFDYSELDKETAEFLKTTAKEIKKDADSLATITGERLFEAQQKLANHRNGCFQDWCKIEVGISFQTAHNLINRYNFIIKNFDNKNLLEELPLSLSYQVSKPEAPKELLPAVFNGDIRTHKEYKELEKKLKAESEENDKISLLLKEKSEQLNSKTNTIKQLLEKNIETKIEYRDDPEKTKKFIAKIEYLNEQINIEREKLKEMESLKSEIKEAREITAKKEEYEKVYKQIENLKKQMSKVMNDSQQLDEIFKFSNRLSKFIKEEMLHIATLVMPPEEKSNVLIKNLTNSIKVLNDFIYAIEQKFLK